MKFSAPRKAYKIKDGEANLRKSKSKKNYYKTQNLNLGATKESTLEELQGLIGNQGMLYLLEELGNLGVAEGDVLGMGELVEFYGMNSTMQRRKEEDDMSHLIDNQKRLATDAVAERSFGTKHSEVNNPDLKANEWQQILKGFVQLVNVLKTSDLTLGEKDAKRKEEDLLLNKDEELKRKDMGLLITMIRKLPDYNGEPGRRQDYFKVLRFMIAAGIDIKAILKATGNYEKQRNQIIGALGGRLPSETNDT